MSVAYRAPESDPVASAAVAAEAAARAAAESAEAAARTAADATKQDAATAATDTELAAEATARDAAIATHAGLKRNVHGIPSSVGSGQGLVGDGSGGWSAVSVAQYAAAGTFTKQQTIQPDTDTVPLRALLNPASGVDRAAFAAGTGTPYGPPPSAPTVADAGVAGNVNGTVKYAYTEGDSEGETTLSPVATITVTSKKVNVTLPRTRRGAIGRKLYRTVAGGNTFFLVSSTHASESGGNWFHSTRVQDNVADASLGVQAPTQDTTAFYALSVRKGVKYLRTPPDLVGVGDFTIMSSDPSDPTAWAIDSYGPIIARSHTEASVKALHTGNTGASFQAYYIDDLAYTDAGTPVPSATVFSVLPKGTVQLTPYDDVAAVFDITRVAGATGHVLTSKQVGDTQSRVILDSDGFTFGPGNAAVDVTLKRTGAATLGLSAGKLDQITIQPFGGSSSTPGLNVRSGAGTDTGDRFRVRSDGALFFGDGAGAIDGRIDRQGVNLVRMDLALGLNTTSFGSAGKGVLCLGNASAVPTGNIAGGQLYAEAGALKWRGSSGTVTVLAPA